MAGSPSYSGFSLDKLDSQALVSLPGSIKYELSNIEAFLEQLHAAIGELEAKLAPVLNRSLPGNSVTPSVPTEAGSPIRDAVRGYNTALEALLARIRELEARVDLD